MMRSAGEVRAARCPFQLVRSLTTSLELRGARTVVGGSRIIVPAPASQILPHLRDCTRDGVSIIAQRRQQISSLDEFGNHLTGGRWEGGPNDFTHGTGQIFIFRSVETLHGN
jgi:hypothetical protein